MAGEAPEYHWKQHAVSIQIPLTPETSVYALDSERRKRDVAAMLSRDLFGPSLVDQYGRPVSAPTTMDGGAAVNVPMRAERLSEAKPSPHPTFCAHPIKCAGLSSCPRDRSCID